MLQSLIWRYSKIPLFHLRSQFSHLLSEVFVSTEELDAYLTVIQTTIDEEND